MVTKAKPMNHFLELLILIVFLFPSFAIAQFKEIVSEGTYNMGDGETPTVAESRALLQAKRVAVEQAGTYIESYSKVKNFQLTQDEIQVLASGIMEVTILEKKRSIFGDGINFWIKIKAKVSADKIEEMARKVKEKSVVEDYKRLQQDYEKLAKDMESLKKQLKEAKSVSEKKQVEDKISESERLFLANRWFERGMKPGLNKEDEIDSLSKAIELNPNHEMAYLFRAWIYTREKMYARAIEDYTSLIKIDPTITSTYHLRASVYEKAFQYDRAIEDQNRVIAMNPNDSVAYVKRGYTYKKQGLYDQAIKDYNKAIALNPKNGSAYRYRGNIYNEMEEYDKAIENYNKAISIEPGNESAYFVRGIVFEKKGQLKRAIADFTKACDRGSVSGCEYLKRYSIKPKKHGDTIEAIFCIVEGESFLEKKEFDKAIKEFTKAINIDPYDASHYYNRGIAYEKKGQKEKAKADFREACDLGDEYGCQKANIRSDTK